MSDKDQFTNYSSWPLDPDERMARALDLFGRHMVSVHDNWIATTEQMLFEGWRYKSPTRNQALFLDWIAQMKEEDRSSALLLVENVIQGVIFSFLNHLDGTTGPVLRDGFHERLRMILEVIPDEQETPSEVFALIGEEDLHYLWWDWINKHSKYQSTFDDT